MVHVKIESVNICKVLTVNIMPHSKYCKCLLKKMEYHVTINILSEEYFKIWKNIHSKSSKKDLYIGS